MSVDCQKRVKYSGLDFWKSVNSTKNLTFEISEMVEFSKEAQNWMAEDDKNIVVIHCKGGKGKNILSFYFSVSKNVRKIYLSTRNTAINQY